MTTQTQDADFLARLQEELEIDLGDCDWVLDWVRDNFTPDEVFSREQLDAWAESVGYE